MPQRASVRQHLLSAYLAAADHLAHFAHLAVLPNAEERSNIGLMRFVERLGRRSSRHAPENDPRKLMMTSTTETLPAETGTDITRFNALRHGVLSRYTVLPWESTDEYRAVVEALRSECGWAAA
jgi:hypothetical protein